MRIITIVCWVVTALVLAGLAAWFLTGTVFGIRTNGRISDWNFGVNIRSWEVLTGSYELDGTYNIGTAGLDSISIDWASGGVTVKPYDGNDIRISEFAQRELQDKERLAYETSGGTLTVRYLDRGITGPVPSKKLEVLVPRPLCEALRNFTVSAASASVNAADLTADTIDIHAMSGSIDLSGIASGTFNADSSSGSISVSSIQSGDIRISSLSGSVRVSDSGAGTFNCNTSSGSIRVSGAYNNVKLISLSGRITLDNSASRSVLSADSSSGSQELSGSFDSVDAKSLSGSVMISSPVVPASLRADTSSGSITIAVPNEGEIRVHHTAASGKLSSDIPIVVVQGGGNAQFNLTSLSGNAKITAYK